MRTVMRLRRSDPDPYRIAAGAMLTMIAQTMLPQAYFKGSSIIGFSTLLGFLAAIWFKPLE